MASGAAIKAGEAFVAITADDSKLQIGLRKAQAKIKSFAQTAAAIGATMTAAGGAILGVAAMAAKHFAAAGDQLDKMAARTGMSVESLGELKFAAEQSGAGIGEIEKSVRAMQRQITAAEVAMQKLAEKGNLDDISEEAKNASNALRSVGLTLDDLRGLSPEQQFERVAEALRNIKDDGLRSGAAMQIWGKGGAMLLPMLNNMSELRAEAQRLGVVMSKDQTDAAAALTDAINRVRRVYDAIINQIGTGLAPMLIDLANTLAVNGRAVIDMVSENKDLLITITKLGAVLSMAGSGFLGMAVAAYGLSKAVGVVGVALKTIGVIAASTAGTVGVMAGAFAAVVAVYAVAIKASDAYASALGKTSDYAQKALDKERELQKESQLQMQRLQQLADKTRLNNQEQSEAADLIKRLTSQYGDLGVSIDTTTGKIRGMTGAQDKLNQKMRAAQIDKMKAALAEQKLNMTNLQREIDDRANSGQIFGKNSGLGNLITGNRDKLQAAIEKQGVEQDKYFALRNELNAFMAGNEGAGKTGSDDLQQRIEQEKSSALKSRKEIEDAEKRLADFRESAARRSRSELENQIADIRKESSAHEEILQKLRDTASARGEAAKAAEYDLEITQARADAEERIAKAKADTADRVNKEQAGYSAQLSGVFADADRAEEKRREDEGIDKALQEDKGAGMDVLSKLIGDAMIRAAQAREQTEARIAAAGADGSIDEEERKQIELGIDSAREAKARQTELEAKARAALDTVASVPAMEVRGTAASFGSAAGLAVGAQTGDQQRQQELLKATKDTADYTRRTYEVLRDSETDTYK